VVCNAIRYYDLAMRLMRAMSRSGIPFHIDSIQEAEMKSVICAVVVLAACAVSTAALAQQNAAPATGSVSAQQVQPINDSSYGGSTNESAHGSQQHALGFFQRNSAAHSNSNHCVGPVSYCDVFFGS
jgi:hypothetical protein